MTMRRTIALTVLIAYFLFGIWTFALARSFGSILAFCFVSVVLWFILRYTTGRRNRQQPQQDEKIRTD